MNPFPSLERALHFKIESHRMNLASGKDRDRMEKKRTLNISVAVEHYIIYLIYI